MPLALNQKKMFKKHGKFFRKLKGFLRGKKDIQNNFFTVFELSLLNLSGNLQIKFDTIPKKKFVLLTILIIRIMLLKLF